MIEVPIVTTYNGKGIKSAQSGLNALGASAGKALTAVGLATAAFSLAKSSLHAFAEEQKQVAIMTNTLRNQGFGYLAQGVQETITKMQLATGISDDELRPAFDKLFLATGSVSKSLKALNLAMDVSVGTGKDLQSVSQALAKGYLGNTTSLTRLGAGLSKAILATGDMAAITKQLESSFSGSASTAAQTFSGQMAILTEHAREAKEMIGANLVSALGALDNNGDGIKTLTRLMDDLAKATNLVVDALAGVALEIKWVAGLANPMVKLLRDIGVFRSPASKSMGKPAGLVGPNGIKAGLGGTGLTGPSASTSIIEKLNSIQKAKDLAALQKKQETQTRSKIALDKAHLAIMTLGNKFDMKRIELQAVIDGTATESQKASARAQLALLDAQDKLTLNTLAGSNAALNLVNSGIAELIIKDKLATKEALAISATQSFADALTNASKQMMTSANDWVAFRSGERGNTAGNSNVDNSGSRGWDNGDSGRRSLSNRSDGGITVIVQTPVAVTPQNLIPLVQSATQGMAMNGMSSGRNSDIVWL